MTVYCVMDVVEWEGEFLVAIFSTEALAQAAIDKIPEEYKRDARNYYINPVDLDPDKLFDYV